MLRKTIIKDLAFEGAGQVPGIESWRIENLKPVKKSEVDVKYAQIISITCIF